MKVKPTSAVAQNVKGFSLIELLVVLMLIMILSGVSFFYMNSYQRLYKPDDQSLQIVDILQEARQRSLTQRGTFRVEVDITANVVRLIDEGSGDERARNIPPTVNNDSIIRQVSLLSNTEVRVDTRPDNIVYNPPEELPAPSALFRQSTYRFSPNNQVCTMRFLSGGTVVDAGNDNVGNGAVMRGVTLHVWSPTRNNPNVSEVARAITVIGSTGSIRLWEFNPASEEANKWQDSRRTGGLGGR